MFYQKRYLKLYLLLLTLILTFHIGGCNNLEDKPIKVGILHSLTGTMAISEKSVAEATQLAIKEINATGGLLGRQLKAVLVDGQSDWNAFAKGARTLITDEKVSVIFGCWNSASRKKIIPILEKNDHLLFYPAQYEGLEQSRNIIYTGAVPNQQISPAVLWSTENLGRQVYLVGSDYVFPKAANTLIKKQLSAIGAFVVGENYLPLGSQRVDEIVDDISISRANVILNTINGDSNLAFFQQLHSKNIKVPVVSFSFSESELQHSDQEVMMGHYSASNYFQSLDSPENTRFVANFKKEYGGNRTTNSAMAAAYSGVFLWAKAVAKVNTIDISTVRQALKGESILGPEGRVTVSAMNNHLWKPLHIGRIEADKEFKIVWSEIKPIRPLPYPKYRSKQSWQRFLGSLYKDWNNSWAAPEAENKLQKVKL
ncbi:MAG: urea ABC transporter substrate-binding protein [Gammaproteobacteria bacterium]